MKHKQKHLHLAKCIVTFALALAMVIASLPEGAIRVRANDPTDVKSGECGTEGSSVTWEVTELETINGIPYYRLTFSGTGEIKYYSGGFLGEECPWDYFPLKEVVIEEGVTNIPDYAFYNDYNLESIVLPKSLQKIGSDAFSSTKISTIEIPANVSDINYSAFYGANELSAVNVDSENKYYSSKNGVLFDKLGTDIKYCPVTMSSYEIPDGTKTISGYAFAKRKSGTELKIPCSVMEINSYAFYYSSGCKLIYNGTEDQWNEVSKNIVSDPFSSTSKVFATGYSINVTGGTAVATAVPGSTVTVKADDIDGKAFESWTSTESDVVFDDATAEITTFVMPDHEVNISGSHVDATTYTITVVDGTATKTKAVAGKIVTVKANNPQAGKLFSTWTGTGVEFADAKAETTTFTMPANDVTITANYANVYKVTVIDGTASSYFVAEGKTITISAKDIKGKLFSEWTSDEVTFTNANAASTTFTMPAKDVTVKANYVDDPTYWYCGAEGDGSNVTWSINEDGDTLTISGTGAMKDYGTSSSYYVPWIDKSSVSSIVIDDGITQIGNDAFKGFSKITSITFPDSMTRIGDNAFGNCSSLTAIVLGSGIKEIGENAFANCDIKTSLTIPDGVEKIGEKAFYNNINLESVTIGKNTNPIAWGDVFNWCDSLSLVSVDSDNTAISVLDGVLFSKDGSKIIWYPANKEGTSYDIPANVTEIADYAFGGNKFKSIVIPGNVKKIGNYAFTNSSSCTSLKVSEGVDEIGAFAFGFSGIGLTQDIVIPKSVKKIGSHAFSIIPLNVNILICGENVEFEEGGVTGIGQYFSGKIITPVSNECDNLFGGTEQNNKYTLICSAPVPDTDTFEYNGSEITFIEEGANCGYTLSGNRKTEAGNYTATATLNASRAVIAETNSGSVSYVWGDLSKPETWIDATDTADKTYEWSIVAATQSGYCGASGHEEDVTWTLSGDTLTISGTGAMADYPKKDPEYYGEYENIKNIVISEGITRIGDCAFWSLNNVETVTIADTVETIGDNAFQWCSALSTVNFGNGIKEIGDYTFAGCIALSTVNFGSGIKEIGDFAFEGCKIASFTIPETLEKIGYSIFLSNSELTYIDIGKFNLNVESVLRIIGFSPIKSISVDPDNTAYTVEDNVLFNKDKTKLIYYPAGKTDETYAIPATVTEIGTYAFDNYALTSIDLGKYSGELDWLRALGSITEVLVDQTNTAYTVVDNVLFNKDKTKLLYYPAGKTDETYTIPATVTEIGTGAFYNYELKTITIPGKVKKIGDYAFCGCHLQSLTIEEGVEEIGAEVFPMVESTIIIPKSVKHIGSAAFGGGGGGISVDVYICGEKTELDEDSFPTMTGTMYAPATVACENLENHTHSYFNIVKICTVPNPEKDTFAYTSSEITAFEPETNCGYTVSGNKETSIGNYTVSCKLNDKIILKSDWKEDVNTITYVWGDLSKPETWAGATDSADKTFNWSIVEQTVPEIVLESIAISTAPNKVTYTEGEKFDTTGMVVTATYSDNTSSAVTGYTWTPNGNLTTSDNTITVSYTDGDVTKTATQAITVQADTETGNEQENGSGNEQGSGSGNEQESGSGNEQGSGSGNEQESGSGNEQESGSGNEQESGSGNEQESSSGNEQESGSGNEQESGSGNEQGSGSGNEQESGSENEQESGSSNEQESGSGNEQSNSSGNEQQNSNTNNEQQNNTNNEQNSSSNNTGSNSGTTNSGTTNSGTTNSGTTNSGTTNSGTTNSGTTNSGTTNSGTTNNGSTNGTTNNDKQDKPSDTDNNTPVVTKNADGTSTATEVKENKDGSTVKTSTTTDADGKLLEKVTEITDKGTDGKVTVSTTTEKVDGTQTVNEVTTDSKGKVLETVSKEISTDQNRTVTEKSVTSKSNGTTIESTKTTNWIGKVVTDTVETRKTGTVITTNTVEMRNNSSTVTKEITKKDGSKSVSTTSKKKNGSSTTETIKTDSKGKVTSYSMVTVDKEGNEETVSYSVKKQAKGKGKKATPGTVRFGKVNSKAEKVEIPDQITINGKKYKVNAISAYAFSKNESITEVVIGSNVKTIGTKAFSGAKNLKNIYIASSSLKKIGEDAFAGISEDATITIQADGKDFDRIVKLLNGSGISSNVTIQKAE